MAIAVIHSFLKQTLFKPFSTYAPLTKYAKVPEDDKRSKLNCHHNYNQSKLQSKEDSEPASKKIANDGKVKSENQVSKIICDPIIPIEQKIYDFDVKHGNKKE